jgi:hypothetical protein
VAGNRRLSHRWHPIGCTDPSDNVRCHFAPSQGRKGSGDREVRACEGVLIFSQSAR